MIKRTIAFALLPLMLLSFLSCSSGYYKGDTKVYMHVGGIEVTGEQLRYVSMKNAELQCQKKGVNYSKKEVDSEALNETVLEELRLYYAVETLAAKNGISLSEKDVAEIETQIAINRESFDSEKAYKKYYAEKHMTENVFFIQTQNYYLSRNLYYHFYARMNDQKDSMYLTTEQLREDINDHFYCAVQIMMTDSNATDPQTVYEKLQNGEDFYKLAEYYSVDSKEPRYFTDGEMVEEFEEAVKSLKVGEYSKPVKSALGTHIILRLPLDEEYIENNLDAFRDTDTVRIYNEMLKAEGDSLEIVYEERYEGLILDK